MSNKSKNKASKVFITALRLHIRLHSFHSMTFPCIWKTIGIYGIKLLVIAQTATAGYNPQQGEIMILSIWLFLLAVFFVVVNGATQLFYAQSLGYKLKPTGLAYFVGAIGNLLTGSVVPISGQAETITMSGLIKNLNVRVASLLVASAVGMFLGVTGLLTRIVDFSGTTVISGMMAGVGLILANVGVSLVKQELRAGLISIVSAIAVWVISHDVVFTIAASVFLSSLDYCLFQKRRVNLEDVAKKAGIDAESTNWKFWTKEYWADFKLIKPRFTAGAIVGGLGFICLNIGSNISFGNITASIAKAEPKLNELSFINSLADIPSILFGGMPIEAIISGTAGAPWPVAAGVVMMAVSGALLLTGLMTKIGRYVPSQSIAGFLLIIGFALTLVPNFSAVAASASPLEGIVAGSVTMLTGNAFAGMAAGILVKITGTLFGIV
jgi:AGZA family xanthine/uracil permease-like MFS transporter